MRTRSWLTAALVAILVIASGVVLVRTLTISSRAPKVPASTPQPRRILYYRSPMNPAIHSPVPMKDGMGMAYLPVYAPGAHATGGFTVDHRLRQSYGVRTITVGAHRATPTLTAPGVVAIDRHRLVALNPRVDGWLRQLSPDTVGDPVHAGAIVGRLYAPALRAAESDYLMLHRAHAGADLLDAVMMRLARLGLGARSRRELAHTEQVPPTVPLYAPAGGVVEKIGATPGHYVTPSTAIITIAPLSPVWVRLSLPPAAAGRVHAGDGVVVRVQGATARGVITYIYPTINSRERTLTVRARLANPQGWLRPGLYVRARVRTRAYAAVLTIPRTAVLHTGTGIAYVFVATGKGHFRLQRVTLGAASGRTVIVQSGLHKGVRVVVHGLFLLDADSHIHGLAARLGKPEGDHD